MTTDQFSQSPEGRVYESSVRESAARLHAMFPELDPQMFESFLAVGRTWTVLTRLGSKYYATLGLTEHQLSTLRYLLLAEGNRLTIGDIAELQATSSTNITKLINRMQQAGFVRRVPDSGDRRVIWVELTSVGRERYIASLPTSSLDREAFGVLGAEEQSVLIDLLSRVHRKALELARDQMALDMPPLAMPSGSTSLPAMAAGTRSSRVFRAP